MPITYQDEPKAWGSITYEDDAPFPDIQELGQKAYESRLRAREARDKLEEELATPQYRIGIRKPFSDEVLASLPVPAPLAAFGVGAQRALAPTGAGAAAASAVTPYARTAGAALRSAPNPYAKLAAPVVEIGLPLAAGAIGAIGTGMGQEAVLPEVPAQLVAEHPTAMLAGQIAGMGPFFRPGLPVGATGAERLAVPALTGALGGGIEGAQQLAQGEFDPQRLALATLGSALMNRETGLTRAVAPHVVAPPKPPKSVQILTEPTTKPPSIANVATEIGTQTAESPFALQARLNQMTEAQRRPVQQLALEETFSGLPPKSAQESAEVFAKELPQIEVEPINQIGIAKPVTTPDVVTGHKGVTPVTTESSAAVANRNQIGDYESPDAIVLEDFVGKSGGFPATWSADYDPRAKTVLLSGEWGDPNTGAPREATIPEARSIAKEEGLSALNDALDDIPTLVKKKFGDSPPASDADIRRKYIRTATEAPEVDYQYIVQDFGPPYPRVVQVDAISEGESLASGTVAEFAGAGAKIPEVPEWVPQGKYTREQIEQFIKEGPSNAIREQEAAGRVLRGETPEPELDVGLQGVVGKDQPEVAPGDLMREGAVPEPRTEVEQLMASTPPFEAAPGRSPEATQQASRMRSTRGAVGLPGKQTETKEFKNWFGDSKVVDESGDPVVLYHGTNADFTVPLSGKPGSISARFGGGGIWFAENPKLAHGFIRGGRREGIRATAGSNLIPAYVSIKRPIDFSGRDIRGSSSLGEYLSILGIPKSEHIAILNRMEAEFAPIRDEWASKMNISGQNWHPIKGTTGMGAPRTDAEILSHTEPLYELAENHVLQKIAKEMGYDGIVASEKMPYNEGAATGAKRVYSRRDTEVESKTWLPFDSTQIKSAIGNRGTFDPNNPDIRAFASPKVVAPLGGGALGGAAGYALTEQEPGESDEAFAARRLRNAALGAAAGAAGGLSLTQIGARALAPSPRMKAERGSTVAPPEPGKGQGVRRTAEKVIEERTYPEQMREMLAENPDIVYDKFARRELQSRMEGLTEAELITLRASPDLREKLASTAELANRYSVTPGKEKEAADLIAEFSTYMTSPAQLIGMGSMIRTPETYVAAVNKQLEQVNRTLSKPQTEQVRKLAAEVIRTDKAMGEAQMAAKNDFTDANIAKKDAAEKAHAEAAKALDQYIHDAVPEAWDKIISKVIQGNLMSPISLMRNVGGNILWQPIRRTSTAIASLLDAAVVGVSKVAGRPKERVLGGANPLPSGEEIKAAGEGIRTAAKELLTGPGVDSYVKSEVQRGFRPLRALVQAWKGDGLAVRPDGTISLNDRAKKAVEAVFGAAPEAIFRGLNLGDKPFRRAAEVEFLRNEGKARGLKGRELNRFVMFPDKATQRLLETEGRKAIFAQENRWAREIKRAIDTWPEKMFENPDDHPFLVGATKVFLRTQLPFVQFPANYVTTAARYAFPWITAPAALLKAAKGDRRGALNLMAEAMMGSMMYGAAAWLWKNGLISEPVEKDSKARSVQYERMGPQRLNITGLQRALAGGDGTFKRGDTTVDWGPMGIPSAPLYVFTRTASQKRGEEAKLGAPQRGNFAIDALGAFPGMASFAFDQSFLSGTASALNAMQDWEQFGDRWTQNMFRAITSFPIPSTAEAAARANYEYIPELRGDTLGQTLKNIWDYKTFQLPEGGRAILKRDIWGEPIRRTPEGKNPYIHQFLDVTRSEAKPPDRMKSALLEIYRETETPDVYPSVPGRNITVQGTTVQLNPKDYELLQALTGSYRRELTERLVLDPRFSSSSLPADAKIMLLQNEYQQAAELARARLMSKPGFFDSYPELLGRTVPADQSRVQSRTPQGRLLRKAQESR